MRRPIQTQLNIDAEHSSISLVQVGGSIQNFDDNLQTLVIKLVLHYAVNLCNTPPSHSTLNLFGVDGISWTLNVPSYNRPITSQKKFCYHLTTLASINELKYK